MLIFFSIYGLYASYFFLCKIWAFAFAYMRNLKDFCIQAQYANFLELHTRQQMCTFCGIKYANFYVCKKKCFKRGILLLVTREETEVKMIIFFGVEIKNISILIEIKRNY